MSRGRVGYQTGRQQIQGWCWLMPVAFWMLADALSDHRKRSPRCPSFSSIVPFESLAEQKA
jgi:hypothetical protein